MQRILCSRCCLTHIMSRIKALPRQVIGFADRTDSTDDMPRIRGTCWRYVHIKCKSRPGFGRGTGRVQLLALHAMLSPMTFGERIDRSSLCRLDHCGHDEHLACTFQTHRPKHASRNMTPWNNKLQEFQHNRCMFSSGVDAHAAQRQRR
jgi:hypothetical protein